MQRRVLMPARKWAIAALAVGLVAAAFDIVAPAAGVARVATTTVHAAPAQPAPAAVIHLPLAMHGVGLDALPTAAPGGAPEPSATATSRPFPTAFVPSPTPTADATATATSGPSRPTPVPSPTAKLPWWGEYDEGLTDLPSLGELRSGYRAANWYKTMLDVLDLRYKSGRYVVTKLNDSQTNAAIWVGGRTATFDDLLGTLNVTVHEMNHQLGWQEGIVGTGFKSYAFVVRDDLTLLVPRVQTYPRSEIARYLVGPLKNQYEPIYLAGDSGKQGFDSVLDEFNAYTHSLFVAYGIHDQTAPGRRQSDRDGLVTFMMYTQLYLRHARTDHPADYAKLQAEPAMREAVRLLWARANFVLDLTQDIPSLSLDPVAVEAEMRKADMQAEVRDFVLP